ncbi:MAG: DMT family transporter [Acetobacteraceae bacterium]
MSVTAAPLGGSRLADMAPGITAALSFSITDILLKVVYASGMNVLTLVSLRGILVVVFFFVWLRASPPPVRHNRKERRIALALGLLFAGTMFGLLQAVALLPVSIAILAYFIYPLLTGIGGALTGVDRLGWRGFLAALAAFVGLGLMLGAEYDTLAPLGILCAFAAAVARVISLLLTRAYLSGTDARLTTWYSMVPSTLLFLALLPVLGTWAVPADVAGWGAFLGVAATSTLSTLLIYVSTNRIGPFRTAFIMNLEPLVTTLLSMWLLGEVLTPVQGIGAAIMIVSLCAFQLMKGR